MAMITVRNLPDDVHRALRLQAAQNGRSTEAEVRDIIALAVKPKARLLMGDALCGLSRAAGLTNADVEVLEAGRVRIPAAPLSFE